jgi:hypothetical protein
MKPNRNRNYEFIVIKDCHIYQQQQQQKILNLK